MTRRSPIVNDSGGHPGDSRLSDDVAPGQGEAVSPHSIGTRSRTGPGESNLDTVWSEIDALPGFLSEESAATGSSRHAIPNQPLQPLEWEPAPDVQVTREAAQRDG